MGSRISKAQDKIVLVSRSGAPLGSTTSATYVPVFVWALPLGIIGPNDSLWVRANGYCTASSNTKSHSIRVGTNPDGITGAVNFAGTSSVASSVSWQGCVFLRNLGVLNSQRTYLSPYTNGFSAIAAQAIDFSVQQYVSVTLNAAAGEEIVLQSISVWIERGTA